MEFRATLAPPNRKFRSHSAASSEGETSPSSTPEVARKHLKSLGASAQRSMSFLRKKKKHEHRLRPEDIQHSPQLERKLELPSTPIKRELSKKSNTRPKSQVVVNTQDSITSLGKSTLSFEI